MTPRPPTIALTHINEQPIEKPVMHQYGNLRVFKIWNTIQGEGPFAGVPAVFVRLHGCDLQCPACDTDYTSQMAVMSPDYIFDEVTARQKRPGLVVLTGGEPFIQNIVPTINRLVNAGCHVQIETNGTYFDEQFHSRLPLAGDRLSVVCSPKTPVVVPQLRPYVSALKYVVDVDSISREDGLPLHTLGNRWAVARPWSSFCGKIYLQPLDVQDELRNKENRRVAVEACMKHGYTLCLQLHKLIEVE